MKGLWQLLCVVCCLLGVGQASIFSSPIQPSQLVGKYQCHGSDSFYHTKYVGSFTLIPDLHNSGVLIYQAAYNNLNAGQQMVNGLAYIDHDTLVLAFKPHGDIPQGAGNYRVSSGGKFLKGKFIYLTDPKHAKINEESCDRVEK